MFRLNMKDLIRIAVRNGRNVHFLVLKVFVNKLIMHAISNVTVDTNIFDK